MALDPNISLGVRPIQLADPLAQYGQIAQIQAAQQSQQMNALRMQEAQDTMEERNALRRLDPTSTDYEAQLFRLNPQLGISYRKEAATTAAQTAARKKSEFDLTAARGKFGDDLKRSLSSNPSDENIIAFGQDAVLQGLYSPDQVKSTVTQLLSLPAPDRVRILSQAGASAGELKPTQTAQTLGGTVRLMSTPAFGGTATVVPGSIGEVTSTPAQLEQNRIANARLAFEQGKFAYEKANPGYTIQQAEDGSIVGVNTRTLQAFPVSMGGGAGPAAAPVVGGAGGTGMPGARAAQPSVAPATLPGAEPTAAARPLMGKGKEAPAKFYDTDMQLSGLAGSLKEFKEEVGKDLSTGARFLPSGADTARMQAKYTSLLMGVKDLYTLGALAGPDMSIIESQITNPASWSGKMTTLKGFKEQTKVIEDMLKRSAKNLESTYGRVPKSTKNALEAMSSDEGGGNVDTSNPLLR